MIRPYPWRLRKQTKAIRVHKINPNPRRIGKEFIGTQIF